jgi:O-antigen ligase
MMRGDFLAEARSAAVPVEGRARVAFAGLLLYVVLVYSVPGSLFFDGDDVGIAKAAAGLSLGALGLSWLLHDRRLRSGGATALLLALYFAVVGGSAAWSLWPSMTFDVFLDGLKFVAIFFLIVNVVTDCGRAALLVHVIALATVIPAVGTINSWAHGEHLVEETRAAWVGIFGNPNDLAYHLDIGLALGLGARELARSRLLRLAYLAAYAAIATALLLTESRGGLISAGVVLALWAARGLRRGRALIGVILIVSFAAWLGPENTWNRAGTTLDYAQDASAQGRIDAWRTGLNVFKGRPLTGVGAGAFPLSWAEFAPGDAGPARTAHNTLVQVVAETGLPSFLLFGGALLCAALGATAAGRGAGGADGERRLILAQTVQVGLGGFVCCGVTGGLAYSWPLYLLLGLGAALPAIAESDARGR